MAGIGDALEPGRLGMAALDTGSGRRWEHRIHHHAFPPAVPFDPRPHQPRRRGAGRTSTLPSCRRDADAGTRERWLSHYAVLLRERVEEAGGADQPGLDLLGHLFPLLHSVGGWLSAEETCRWLREEGEVTLSASNLRTALRNPADRWALLWREVRGPVRLLARVHRWSAEEMLWGEHVIARLRDAEPHLRLGNLERSRAALEQIRQARAELARRWFAWEPNTRRSARAYLGLVCTRDEDDF